MKSDYFKSPLGFQTRNVMSLSVMRHRADKNVQKSSWTCDGFKQEVFWAKGGVFSASKAERTGSGRSMHTHHPLCSARLYRSRRRTKVAHAASGEEEPSDKVWETADAPMSFKTRCVEAENRTNTYIYLVNWQTLNW